MSQRQAVLSILEQSGIPFRLVMHPAVYTIEEIQQEGIEGRERIVKNLFLRNAKGNQHYLVLLCGDKNADLKALQREIGCSRLSFGSSERLMAQMGLTPGSVSPLGIINNADHQLMVLVDEDVLQMEEIGVHPNENTATVFLRVADLLRLIQEQGNPVRVVPIAEK